MRKGGNGSIINIASVDALHPTGALAHYDASKGGLVMLTRSLALELAPFGVRVNTISPGGIQTPGVKAATAGTTPKEWSPEKIVEAFTARIPMKRMGDPDEIARAALFLASPAASYMTGSNVVVDGGYLLT
jgi:2-deoxy-D-gluconate 3-dehydrogenase